ncbi:MAG TPA: ABC transporter permease subunit [Thermoplasmata archaeon]|nr:ABC transporter permease subunit [Thermoplasmata archaeon]
MAVGRKELRALAVALIALAVVAAVLVPSAAFTAGYLALIAFFSTVRMTLAFLLSLVFAIAYGTAAATNKRAGEFLIPILDILQSVPILAFFPPALLFFVYSFNGNVIGVEFAVIFLIFTSMSWNMAFGVYEALTTLPADLREAATVFGVRDWLRFRRLFFPATIPKLVYNSMLSWTVGWFYLVASEAITTGAFTRERPGLGSFIYDAGQRGDLASIVVGIGVLAIVVLLLDTFLWRPLSVWSERFRMEQTAGGPVSRMPWGYERLRWLPRFPRIRRWIAARLAPLAHGWNRAATPLDRFYVSHPRVIRSVRWLDLSMFLVILASVVVTGVVGIAAIFLSPLPSLASEIPVAVLASLGRLVLAYLVALGWTVPVAAWVAHNERASRLITPVLEVVASIPATALFPLIIAFSVLAVGAFGLEAELAAFLVSLFAMQWYLLFNLIAGMRSLPGDMREAAKVFGLRGWTYWKRVLLPAMTPSLLTGSITAWGAGWNALIVAEYISYAGHVYQVGAGIGYLIAYATYTPGDHGRLLLLSVLALVLVVLAMNKLLWRPIIRRASDRFRIEIQ